MAIRTELTSFNFYNTIEADPTSHCDCDIGPGEIVLTYSIEGGADFDMKKVMTEPNVNNDPVKALLKYRWRVSKLNPRPRHKGEPTGFRKDDEFDALSLRYTFTGQCSCADPPKTNTESWRVTVHYDRSSNKSPTCQMTTTAPDAGGMLQRVTPDTRTAPTDTPGENSATLVWRAFIDCPCSRDAKPCTVWFGVEYTYRTVVVED